MKNQPSLLGYILLITNLLLFWYFLRGKNFKIYEQTQNKLNFTIQPKWFLFIGLFIAQIGIICLYTCLHLKEKSSSNPTRHLQNQEFLLSHLVNRFAY